MADSAFQLRPAATGDCAALAAFWRDRFVETFGHLYRPEDLAAFVFAKFSPAAQLAEILDPRGAHRLAFRGARLEGAAQVGALKIPYAPAGGRATLELRRLYLITAAHGTGLADELMGWAKAEARARGAADLVLSVWSENFRAQRFYARHGFAQAGTFEFAVGAARDLEWILRAQLD